jgi:hypothetical protein
VARVKKFEVLIDDGHGTSIKLHVDAVGAKVSADWIVFLDAEGDEPGNCVAAFPKDRVVSVSSVAG